MSKSADIFLGAVVQAQFWPVFGRRLFSLCTICEYNFPEDLYIPEHFRKLMAESQSQAK